MMKCTVGGKTCHISIIPKNYDMICNITRMTWWNQLVMLALLL